MSNFKDRFSTIILQASQEARKSNSSIRIRGTYDYLNKPYADPDDERYTSESIKFDVQVTPDGVVHGPNVEYK